MRIDKDSLLSVANCIDVAQYIGIETVQRGANTFMLCPGHMQRLGKRDTSIGSCVVYPDGYICYACDPSTKHDVFDMVMEHNGCSFVDAIKIVAEIYGGAQLYQTAKTPEKLPLSPEDLRLLGLKASGKVLSPVNGDTVSFDPEEGTYIEKGNNEYLLMQVPSSFSLLNLKRDNEEEFNRLIARRAKSMAIKYRKALDDYGTRMSPKANVVFDLFNTDGSVDDSVFFGIQNALKLKIWRCKEIYQIFNSANKK